MIVITFYECLALFFIVEEQHLIKLSDTFSSKNVTNAVIPSKKQQTFHRKHFYHKLFRVSVTKMHFLTIAHL